MALVVIFIVLMPATLVWAAKSVSLKGTETEQVAAPPSSLMTVLRSVGGNRPFLLFVAITTLAGTATGMNTGLSFLYVQDYLHLGSYFFILGIVPGIAVLTTPFWLWMSRLYGKHRTWAVGLFLSAILGLPVLLLRPGMQSLVPLIVIIALNYVLQGVIIALPLSVLADIADYEAWKQNTRATGNYFALLVLLSKVTTAVGSSLALAISGWMGYAPHANGTANFAAIMVPFVAVPTVMVILASVLIYCFPLDRRRHGLIIKRLAEREERLRAASAA
jgi:Na+/melibiose symporter-like transporter